MGKSTLSNHARQNSIFVKHRDEYGKHRQKGTTEAEPCQKCGHCFEDHDDEIKKDKDWSVDDHTENKLIAEDDCGPDILTAAGPKVSLR